MERSGLRVVRREEAPRAGSRAPVLVLASAVLLVAGWATLRGAGGARAGLDLDPLLDRAVRAELVEGTTARAAYAALLAEGGASRAAAREAIRAAGDAPVTVPVLSRAAETLARTGRAPDGAEIVRGMFAYAPGAAARLWSRIRPFAGGEDAVPDDAPSLAAWARELRLRGSREEADAVLDRAVARFPEDLPLVEHAASVAAGRGDLARVRELLPPGRPLGEGASGASLRALRARAWAEEDPAAARRDLDEAIALAPESPAVLAACARAAEASGDVALARDLWSRAAWRLPRTEGTLPFRRQLALGAARLESAHGTPAQALRSWREVRALDPGNAEAARALRELGAP